MDQLIKWSVRLLFVKYFCALFLLILISLFFHEFNVSDHPTIGMSYNVDLLTASSENKMTRVDAQSPVTAQTTQQQQTPSAHQQQQQQQQQQQAFINATLPPGYNYYYPTGSVLPGGYSYPATMFPVSVNV